MASKTPTPEQIKIISENWQTKNIPQLMRLSGLTRHLVIGVCCQAGFVPKSAVRTANYKDIYQPQPKKSKKYFLNDKGGKVGEEPEVKKPFIRPSATYTNVRSLYKELQLNGKIFPDLKGVIRLVLWVM